MYKYVERFKPTIVLSATVVEIHIEQVAVMVMTDFLFMLPSTNVRVAGKTCLKGSQLGAFCQ